MNKKDFKSKSSQAAEMFITTREPEEQRDKEELKPKEAEGAPAPEAQEEKDAHKEHKAPNEQEEPKKQKIQKLNVAFYGNNMEYLNIISRVKGISITQYINDLVTKDQEGKEELISQAKAFFEEHK